MRFVLYAKYRNNGTLQSSELLRSFAHIQGDDAVTLLRTVARLKPQRPSNRPAYRRRNLKQGAARNFCGERVRSLRRELALTQDEFAARCHVAGNWNVDRFLIAKIEAGERAVTDLELRILIKALKTTPAALIGD